MNGVAKHLGVTPPVSTSPSNPTEIAVTDALLESLKKEGQFESEEASRNREHVLGQVDKLAQEFVYRASLKHGLSEEVSRECRGKIFTFGSYRLGVHGAGADIDTLCVVPAHVKRTDFFEIMVELLRERPEVEDLTPVHEAFVPVIKLNFNKVDMDLTFASLQLPTIPEDLELLDTNLLRNLDDASIRSVNGSRVTDEVLRLVPNVPNFRLALRCIKLWAKRRAIYSNAMGFFGGIAWAMLVARVCQLYPNACAGAIIARFFRIMFNWKWPSPVLLKTIEDGPLHVRVWNPKLYAQDEAHKMPIITPAYPSMCATHNVSTSTKTIIMAEFKRGAEILDRIMLGKAKWEELFEKSDFFYRYKHYLQVNIATENDDEAHHKLHGLVDARIRHFVMKLEAVDLIVLAHPYIKSFDHEFSCKSKDEIAAVIRDGTLPQVDSDKPSQSPSNPENENTDKPSTAQSDASGSINENAPSLGGTDGDEPNEKTTKKIYTSAFYLGLLVKEKVVGTNNTPNGNGKRRMDLSWPTQEYIKLIKQADFWDDETMSMSVRFLKKRQLPDEVFDGKPRSRKHYLGSSSPLKRKKSKTNKSVKGDIVTEKDKNQNLENNDINISEMQPSKKLRSATTPVPSTSGSNIANDPSKDKRAEAQQQAAAAAAMPAASTATKKITESSAPTSSQSSAPVTVVAPVPLPTKTGGIKLKLAAPQ